MKPFAAISIAISAILSVHAAEAAGCRETTFDGAAFTVCQADPATDDIRLFLNDDDGDLIGTFTNLEASLPDDRDVVFAMNGGMYHTDRAPVGLYLENGDEVQGIITNEGPGNFGLLPNGVLCLGPGRASVIESRAYAETRPDCRYATQSGPMLVIDGALHPRFLPGSDSVFHRNGVGVAPDGTLFAAISDDPVTFHHFARFFRDALGTPNALFLEGNVSRLHAPDIGRSDFGFPMGPMLGVVGPAR